jgi:hypothetical protein
MQPRDRWVTSFDLSIPRYVEDVREFVLPVVLKAEDRTPLGLIDIQRQVKELRTKKDDERREAMRHAQHRERLSQGLPESEQEVIVFGAPMWPSERNYSFSELVHACWFADFMFDILRAEKPVEKTMNLLHALKFLEAPMLSGGTMLAIRDICSAYVKNPGGMHKLPPKPLHFFKSS